jgi:tetratricopeptide (TPR) repeat protein
MARHYPEQPQFLASGKLIKRLVSTLVNVKDWSREQSMSYIGEKTQRSVDMIYRWQQGRSQPKPEIIEILAQIAYGEANLSREWGEELLLATHYKDAMNLLNNLWGPRESRVIPSRLGKMEHTRLIGRQEERKQLQELLFPRYAAHIITVDGIGGVGKTALALDVAHQCWQASTGEIVSSNIPTFEAIIFITAKQQYLTPQGILQQTQAERTLRKIFQEVTKTLGRHDIIATPSQEQADLVREILGRQRTLLIIDNLETMEDKQEIISFLYQLPPTVKVVVTTRERTMFAPIRLEQLVQEAARELIEQQAEEKRVKLETGEAQRLYERIGGIPAALVYAVGQRADGYSLETVLRIVPDAEGDVARFCFQGSVEPLRATPAHTMLMALSLFPQMPLRPTVNHVSGLDDRITTEEALAQLQRLSLVREFQDHFRMLPLTREYALAELGKHPDFEQDARQRWVDWYLGFAQRYGGHDSEEWHVRFDHLEDEWENLQAVFDWCAIHEQYDVIKRFWCADEESSVIDFSTTYGHWDDRLIWLSWLADKAGARGDWLTLLDALASHGFTLTLMGRHDEAEEAFKRGHLLRQQAEPRVEARFLLNHGYLRIYQKRHDEADAFFDQATKVAQHVPRPVHTRLMVSINYDRAANSFFRQDDIAAVQASFRKAEHSASAFGWQRMANHAQNYLANIAIQEGNYEEAERLLGPGLTLAERNNERRRAAGYRRSYARLKQKQGRFHEALDWAREAREGYERLGAKQEIQGLDELIQELRAQTSSKK